MLQHVTRRLLHTVPVLFGASVIIFMMIHLLPGDPASVLAGPDASPEQIDAIRDRLALNEPITTQYVTYMSNILQGDFGTSYYYHEEVSTLIVETMPATIELATTAMVFALLIAIPLGVVSATHRNSWVDFASMVAAVIGISIPVFFLGILLIFFFAVNLDWLPASGRGGPLWTAEGLTHIILPAVSLGSIIMASTMRLTRGSMLEVLQEDFVRTARAKGLRSRIVTYRHALRPALIPVVTNIGLQVGGLLGGSFLTETVFAWPGIGRLSVDAMFRRDYPLIQGTMMMVVLFFILANLIVDIIYIIVDPRISYK